MKETDPYYFGAAYVLVSDIGQIPACVKVGSYYLTIGEAVAKWENINRLFGPQPFKVFRVPLAKTLVRSYWEEMDIQAPPAQISAPREDHDECD